MTVNVNAEKALIFRVVHRDNLSLILESGLWSQSHSNGVPYRNIGNPEIIDKRSRRGVPIAPGGTLSDYIPFYFTYASPMLYNISTEYGVPRCPNSEIVFLVSSLHKLASRGVKFLFTDRHAVLATARYFDDMGDLNCIDWEILQRKDFRRDPNDPGKVERYQAEVLAYKEVPLSGLLGFACYNEQSACELKRHLEMQRVELPVYARPRWYFS